MQARTKKEQHLEFCQALADMREGRFTTSNKEEIFELAALAVFKDLHEGMSDVEHEEELVLEENELHGGDGEEGDEGDELVLELNGEAGGGDDDDDELQLEENDRTEDAAADSDDLLLEDN